MKRRIATRKKGSAARWLGVGFGSASGLDPDVLLGVGGLHAEIGEDGEGGAEDEEDDGGDGPDEGRGERHVPDERVVGEVRGVAVGLAGAVRPRGPRGPEEERRHGPRVGGVADEAAGDRHRVGALAEEPLVVRDQGRQRRGLPGRQGEGGGGLVVAVQAQLGADLGLDPPPLAGGERLEVALREGDGAIRREAVDEAGGGEPDPVEDVGGPVRREVRAVAPDRAGLLTAAREVLALPEADVVAGEDDLPGRRHDALGDGRLVPGDLRAPEEEDAEAQDDDEEEDGTAAVGHVERGSGGGEGGREGTAR